MKRLLILPLAFLLTGCVVTASGRVPVPVHPPHHHEGPGDPPAPPPPAPARPLSREEVADLSMRIAAERGYGRAHIEKLERKGHERWKVKIEGWASGAEGKLELELDGWDGRVLELEDEREHDDGKKKWKEKKEKKDRDDD